MSTHGQSLSVPKGQIECVVEDEMWGRATIYDLNQESISPPQQKPQEQYCTLPRKSMITKIFIVPDREGDEEKDTLAEAGEDEFEDVFFCLPFFPASLFATVLEDTITQTRILIECNTNMRITKTLSDMSLLLALKYGVQQPSVTDELDGIKSNNLKREEYKLNKLEADRNTITDLFVLLYIALTTKKSYGPLIKFIEHIEHRDEHVNFIIEDETKNRILLKELTRQLRQQRNHYKTVLYESESIIANLKSQVEDAGLMTETQGRYVDNWQSARTEQHKEVINEKESVSTDSTEYFKQRSDHEQRVHAEIESLTNIIITETLKSVEDWMDKYEEDIEAIDLRIQITKNDYQNMWDKRRDMERTYNKHDKEMREWLRFKEERAKAQLYHDTMQKSAIIVQAWWRGLLVRKQLGPFRPKKKGKKK